MGLCGCYPACACQVEAGNALVTVTGTGDAADPFIISGNETAFSAANDDGGIEITPQGAYGHSPRFNLRLEDSETIALAVTETGLSAHLLLAPGEGGGVPTGTPLPTLGIVAPAGYLMLTGPNRAGYVDMDDYPALFAVVGHSLSGGVDPGDGTFYVGFPDDTFLVTHGTLGGVGTTGGENEVTLTEAELPPHDHDATDVDGFTSPAGAHSHTPGTVDRSFVTVETATLEQVRIAEDSNGNIDIVVCANDTVVEPGVDWTQQNNANTSTVGDHAHDAPDGGVTVGNAGSGEPHNNMPKYVVTNFMVKT